jgi:hypothetical protein
MIAPPGFAIFADYVSEIDERVILRFEDNLDQGEYPPSYPRQALVELGLLDALFELPELWLYSTSGALHRVSNQVYSLMFGHDEMSRNRTTFSLFSIVDMRIDIGRIGNAARLFDDPEKASGVLNDKILVHLNTHDFELAKRFAPFDGYYLTVADGQLPNVDELATIETITTGTIEKQNIGNIDSLERILRNLARDGKLPRREDFRRLHAPEMKRAAFLAIWRSIANEFPELSRPGPKPSTNSIP